MQRVPANCHALAAIAPDARDRKVDERPSASTCDALPADRMSGRGDRLAKTKLI